MIPKPKHDIYVKEGDRNIKIAWVHEFNDYELMIGFYGFGGSDPVIAHEYPDRIVTTEEMSKLTITHAANIPPTEIPESHFTFHRDQKHRPGEFHLKYGKDSKHIVQFQGKIDENAPVFLDFFFLSDGIEKYENSDSQPDETDLCFKLHQQGSVALRGQYCGKYFDFESYKKDELSVLGATTIDLLAHCDRKLTGFFELQAIPLNKDFLDNKLPGTFFIIRFPLKENKFLLKTFVFS